MDSCILIIANTGRLLAQKARQVDLKPFVIDCFGDIDTRHAAVAYYQIPSLALVHLIPAVERVILEHGIKRVIYGSGFEYFPESLDYLASCLTILGNKPAVFVRLLNKVEFFDGLQRCGVPYPVIAFHRPNGNEIKWLVKPMQGQGGIGIKRYRSNANESATRVYWQQYLPGSQHSALFLAVQNHVQLIGFNTQWCRKTVAKQAFLFAGIRNEAERLSPTQKNVILDWLQKLVVEFELTGLNTLDFIYTGTQCFALEINARPSASMQLYPAKWLLQHMWACEEVSLLVQAKAQDLPIDNSNCRGCQIVYARCPIVIPEVFEWPQWCVDIPEGKMIIATNQPICSIIAYSHSWRQLMALLEARQQLLFYKLNQRF